MAATQTARKRPHQSRPLGPENNQWYTWAEPHAFEAWVLTYQAELFSFVCGLIGNPNEADGVAVEAFAQVYALAQRGLIKDTPVAELYRIAIRESARRLSRRLRTHPDGRRELAWRILMHLTEDDRFLLLLREVAGYSVPQIASCLNTSEKEVRGRLLASRQSLVAACRASAEAATANQKDRLGGPLSHFRQ